MSNHSGPTDSEDMKQFAMLIASVVRNAMEDFHVKHLSDEQMKELNPIIRNAIYTAIDAFNHYERVPESRRFVDANLRLIPQYWEPPEFLQQYINLWKKKHEAKENDAGSA